MRVLLLHSDNFSYEVTGETSITKQLDPIPEELNKGAADDVLVSMLAIEKGDGANQTKILEKTAQCIIEHCEKLNCKRVFLYPYAHLSPTLEAPRAAAKILQLLFEQMSADPDFTVYRAPFGVYKRFDINVKGHPLSEMGRSISIEGGETEVQSSSLQAEKRKISQWLIMESEGTAVATDKFNFKKSKILTNFFAYETEGSRIADEPPPHIKLMQEHELVDYEPASDAGNFRWYPKGYTIKKALEDQIDGVLNRYGAMQVETPIMYSLSHPALAKYLDKFPARQYQINSDKKDYFLRFAACFGQYLMKHDMQISHRHLPLRLYELTHYSFRREQSGELTGLKRLRCFTMPDMHTLCADVPQAIDEMLKQVKLSLEWMDNLGISPDEYVAAVRVVDSFYKENPDYVKKIAEYVGRPILVEIWPEQYFYFVTKFEVNFIDSQGKGSALCTVQIDVKNPQDFGISYINTENEAIAPLMLHTSISGSIDRNLYALLEQQAINSKKGIKAHFPYWLAPTQTRILPVKEEHNEAAVALAKKLKGRVDIDDRNETIGKRIRSAEKEWIPSIIVMGDKEIEGNTLPFRLRGQEGNKDMTIDEANRYFDEQMDGKAFVPINLPQLLSRRPLFRG